MGIQRRVIYFMYANEPLFTNASGVCFESLCFEKERIKKPRILDD